MRRRSRSQRIPQDYKNAISGHLRRCRSLEEDVSNDVVRFEDGAAECRSWVKGVCFSMNVFWYFQTAVNPIPSRNATAIADPSRRLDQFAKMRIFLKNTRPPGIGREKFVFVLCRTVNRNLWPTQTSSARRSPHPIFENLQYKRSFQLFGVLIARHAVPCSLPPTNLGTFLPRANLYLVSDCSSNAITNCSS